ncbi:unnamed protein product [Chondrus crispus]|uniref:Uncharacterized protein n=1 Tax=Chondrus crispus TaxID=2769 RepID=R7QLM7_CHOCR|nr:unnamed protein product [Chondrus crispus]CDF38381.1 unnamed protein product [Chondrus crispus]|eukprot:XP_005718266.1 unnamed protein product [Chondrus crispus]
MQQFGTQDSADVADTPPIFHGTNETAGLVQPEQDAASHYNTLGTFTCIRYSAASPFVIRKVPIHIPYNLTRGSAVRDGEPRDGSSVGDSPVIMPWQDQGVFDARAFLKISFFENPALEVKARLLCLRHNITLESLLGPGPDGVIWMENGIDYRKYGDRSSFPILKALFAKQSFVILENQKGCGVVNGSFDRDFFDRLLELEAISTCVIVLPEGLLVPAPHRLLACLLLLLVAVAATVLTAVYDDRTNFMERFESAFFILALLLLTVPGIFSLFSSEPNLVRNAVRGKMILTKQSQVSNFFGLNRRDYAMLATRTKGSRLVSKDIGCFLTGTERGTHLGDEPVVQCEDLAHFGVICGQSVHYRTNWQSVCISNRLGTNRTHLTTEKAKGKYWCAGVRENTWVGFFKATSSGS